MYCEDFVDRVLQYQMENRAIHEQRYQKLVQAKKERMRKVSWTDVGC